MTMKKGERVRWYLFANGNEDDVHTPHWHGQTVICNQMCAQILCISNLSELSQLRMFFGFLALISVVKLCVFIVVL